MTLAYPSRTQLAMLCLVSRRVSCSVTTWCYTWQPLRSFEAFSSLNKSGMSLRCGHVDFLSYIFSRSEQGEDRRINAFGICPNRRALVIVSLARILFGLRIFTLDALT